MGLYCMSAWWLGLRKMAMEILGPFSMLVNLSLLTICTIQKQIVDETSEKNIAINHEQGLQTYLPLKFLSQQT